MLLKVGGCSTLEIHGSFLSMNSAYYHIGKLVQDEIEFTDWYTRLSSLNTVMC